MKDYRPAVSAEAGSRVFWGIHPEKGLPVKAVLFLFGALLASGAYAQERPFDCSKAKDPKGCEERVVKLKAAQARADKACEGKQGVERRECMVKAMCAQGKDPMACEERAAKAKSAHRDARAACQGRQGSEHEQCMLKQTCADSKDPAKCEAVGNERLARRERIREACKDKRGEDLKACIREQRSQK